MKLVSFIIFYHVIRFLILLLASLFTVLLSSGIAPELSVVMKTVQLWCRAISGFTRAAVYWLRHQPQPPVHSMIRAVNCNTLAQKCMQLAGQCMGCMRCYAHSSIELRNIFSEAISIHTEPYAYKCMHLLMHISILSFSYRNFNAVNCIIQNVPSTNS